jgi:hypothetical protein
VLLQKNKDDYEQPISFMSKTLRDVELKYSITEKQDYALVKSLKHFRSYVGYNKSKHMCHIPLLRMSSLNKISLELEGKWVSKIQEYDLELNPLRSLRDKV